MDPQGDLVLHLRTAAALTGLLDVWAATTPAMRAVFRSEAPEPYQVGAVPCVIVDPILEGPVTLGSFSSRCPQLILPVRIFARVNEAGDTALSTAAQAMRNFLLTTPPVLSGGAVLVDHDVSIPEDTPTSGPTVGGRRLEVTMLVQETANA
jgi:hypothetical protein